MNDKKNKTRKTSPELMKALDILMTSGVTSESVYDKLAKKSISDRPVTKDQLLKELETAEQERKNLFKQMKPIENKLNINNKTIDDINEKITEIELKEPRTEKERIEYFLDASSNDSSKKYNERDKFFKELFGNSGFYFSGVYHQKTPQYLLSIKLTKGNKESLQNHIEQITKLLPSIKENEDGYKVFGIFEHTLSRHTSYELHINETNNEYILSEGRWREQKFNDLETALKYIQKNHYYD